jgi:hypothetical protein
LHVARHGDAVFEAYRSRAAGARGEQKAHLIVKNRVSDCKIGKPPT